MFIWIIAAVRDGRWYWGLGDPDAGSICVTLYYFLTSMVCMWVARQLRSKNLVMSEQAHPSESPFWMLLSIGMLGLGINKQADLQSLITLYGRDVFVRAGMYEGRRTYQMVFIASIAGVALLAVLVGLWWVRHWKWPALLGAIGIGVQGAFIAIRAASFHHVDQLLGVRWAGMKSNLLLESVGLSLIFLGGVLRWKMVRRGCVD